MLEDMHAHLELELVDESNTVAKEAHKDGGEKLVLAGPDDKQKQRKGAYDYTRGSPSDPDVLAKRNKGTEVRNDPFYLHINMLIFQYLYSATFQRVF